MFNPSVMKDRAAGAIMGAFIGDALALGPHWYYDLNELRRDYGDWIDGYTDPKPGRYHYGLKAGQLSQVGFILILMLRSLVENRGYNYGMPCAIYHQLPAAYYLSARFHNDFESSVLHAVNGGGQNQVRAILAGALTGAQVGLSGIPKRFLEGLERTDDLQLLAETLASQVGNA